MRQHKYMESLLYSAGKCRYRKYGVLRKAENVMREQMKQQMRDMLVTLGKAEAILDSKIKKKDTADLHLLFEDMQNSAITIGTSIEQEEGEGTDTVRLLEEYCELLWQYMVEEVLKERFRIARLLAGKRGEISASLETEFEGRLEIAFFMHRDQSWERMERFYHLMEGRADCYVLTDSSSIPDSVNTRKFWAYDLQERRPDLVFVDDPYNDQEKAGAVPVYDFMEIRENAGIVLYMPCGGENGQDEEILCQVPQIQSSDIILIPSGRMSDKYINAVNSLEGGRDLIKKIYVLDAIDETKLLSRVLENQKK